MATRPSEHTERFTLLRPLLFTIAYEILGSVTDSDDVLQDSYMRWAQVDLATVRDTKSYLAQLVTRQALKAQRAYARRRESYIGPWLPEPLVLDDRDASDDVVLAESVSMAMLVVLETLTPDERAVFVLHDVFGFDYQEISEAVGKTTAAVRQIAHRARQHVHARRKRTDLVDSGEAAEITERFLAAATTGDVSGLVALLAPDVVTIADGDGRPGAARRPVVGAERVAGAIVKGMRPGLRFEIVTANGAPAVAVYFEGQLLALVALEITGGKITHLYAIANPAKLSTIDVPRSITR
jgi:RNA polymerase sigma-70 factor (ECF subfamily)